MTQLDHLEALAEDYEQRKTWAAHYVYLKATEEVLPDLIRVARAAKDVTTKSHMEFQEAMINLHQALAPLFAERASLFPWLTVKNVS